MREPSVWQPRYEYVPTLGNDGFELGVGLGVAEGVVELVELGLLLVLETLERLDEVEEVTEIAE